MPSRRFVARRPPSPVLVASLAWGLLAPQLRAAPPAASRDRTIELTVTTEVALPAGLGPVHVFVPVPSDDASQTVRSLRVDANHPGELRELPSGDRAWHGHVVSTDGDPLRATVRAVVRREALATPRPPKPSADVAAAVPEEARRWLEPDARVPVGAAFLDPILADVRAASPGAGPWGRARAIYDWVVDNVEYKKVGTGWGNGDTWWACTERYGNCTDFHALFISLARTEGIPARFEIGFPVPADRAQGDIGGYHCWVQAWLPGAGWVPVDASEAAKHPEMRDHLFGGQPSDRVRVSTGRDLELGEGHEAGALNYFVDPHVEVGGQAWRGPVERRVSFRVLDDDAG